MSDDPFCWTCGRPNPEEGCWFCGGGGDAAEDDGGVSWWYLSFADATLPEGEQWLGAAYIQADDFLAAVDRAWRLGINPGGEVKGLGPLDDETMDANTDPDHRERLLTEAELGDDVVIG